MKKSIFLISCVFIIALYSLVSGLFYLQTFLVPVLFATLLSMLLLPLVRRLEKKMPAALAIFIGILILLVLVTGIFTMIYTQLTVLADDFPLFKEKLLEKATKIQDAVSGISGVSVEQQKSWLENNYGKILNSAGGYIKNVLLGITTGLTVFLLVLIYIFFFLSLRRRVKNFILQLFKEDQHEKVKEVINKTENLTMHYMFGLLIEILVLGALNSIGFLLLGIKQAIFFGYLGALLNLIPYLGALIATLFPVLAAIVYKDSMFYAFGVVIVVVITQFIDNHFLTPKIVGSHIRINPLATIMVILLGGMLWGISGMILFLPLLGIFKIICDNIESLKPIGYLLGEDDKDKKKMKIIPPSN